MHIITPEALHQLLLQQCELAVLDARELGEFGEAHLFWAVPCPVSIADLIAPQLLPRQSVPVVVVDAALGHAERLASILADLGFRDVSLLGGGIKAWRAAGFALFSGINVPSKAFGEWVADRYATESIDAAELKRCRDSGAPMLILDSRTVEEFERMNIPGAISVPGGELAYRIADLAPDPATLIVVNCAGRTRSILGAESLRRAGIPNRVVALRNGTMGWELAGLACERGVRRRYAAGTPASLSLARARADRFARETGVRVIDRCALAKLAADPTRTLYRLDVRSPEEYRAGHLPGSRSAPGGQLVQATDHWVGVRGARIALIDDTGVRARMTAGWLRQMAAWEVFVVDGALEPGPQSELQLGSEPRREPPDVAAIQVADLLARRDQPGTVIVDCAPSLAFRAGHIPGALWAIRSRMEALAPSLVAAGCVVVTSPDGWLASHTISELSTLTAAPIRVLAGGTEAWIEAGQKVSVTPAEPPDPACLDAYLRPYDRSQGIEAAMRAYLAWETGLVSEIACEASVAFGEMDLHAGA